MTHTTTTVPKIQTKPSPPTITTSVDNDTTSINIVSSPISPSNSSSLLPPIIRRGTSNSLIPPFLSSSTTSPSSKSPTSYFNNKHETKKWRWWNYLTIFITLLILSEIGVLLTSYNLLHPENSPIRIGKQMKCQNYIIFGQELNFIIL
jgi:hypothetical protein